MSGSVRGLRSRGQCRSQLIFGICGLPAATSAMQRRFYTMSGVEMAPSSGGCQAEMMERWATPTSWYWDQSMNKSSSPVKMIPEEGCKNRKIPNVSAFNHSSHGERRNATARSLTETPRSGVWRIEYWKAQALVGTSSLFKSCRANVVENAEQKQRSIFGSRRIKRQYVRGVVAALNPKTRGTGMVQDVCVGHTVPGQSTPLPIPTLTLYVLNLVLVLYGPGSWLSLGAVLPILATIHHSLARTAARTVLLCSAPAAWDSLSRDQDLELPYALITNWGLTEEGPRLFG
ncbi:hypothetical protein DFH94DRAFT_682056 [Russula ochroleuca]|uniref:Uncharacterized protein n=1 Tax=Russula ochroleuca TaxID=152965 RepID=A0A9P5MWB4_9AGAM|nr:hypothetical protein DFH94DRAFT_682056 [Russula ochroleuca]